jgi:hypothetical protein
VRTFLRFFWLSSTVTVASLVVAYFYGGTAGLVTCVILAVLEVSLSFDNAVVNATVLRRMSPFWVTMFLTVGILVAVFGMRVLFPLLVVQISAGLGPVEAVRLALEGGGPEVEGSYAQLLEAANPQIAAFGGAFLAMLFLTWLVDDREYRWIGPVERFLARARELPGFAAIVSLIAITLAARFLADDVGLVMVSGVSGIVTFMIVHGLGELAIRHAPVGADGPGGAADLVVVGGRGGFILFLYLELIDASFSFDGVIGAFAITSDPILIALGLGLIGALFVRSLTVYLVRQGTLTALPYLEHGAHWAIGALATVLIVSIGYHIPELLTGLIGVTFIVASLVSSLRHRRREGAEVVDLDEVDPALTPRRPAERP